VSIKKILTIGGLATASGVSVETIRFYQRKGLVRLPERALGAVRHYEMRDIQRIIFIKAAQKLGFSLAEIEDLLRLEAGLHCDEVRSLALHKLNDIRQKIDHLRRLEQALEEAVDTCTGETVACPLIESLHKASSGLPE
jgi:MerR family mercuric resistance operon transcriptional regulator